MKVPTLSRLASRRRIIVGVVFLLAIGVTLLAWYILQLSLHTAATRAFEHSNCGIERD